MIPQIITASLIFISIGIAVAKHGEQKKEKYNAISAILSSAITFALLYWGGFFDCFFK